MASQVPYSPVPSVGPQDSPTPYREASTPIGAFGGAVAAATQHLGEVSTQSGNEIFDQAAKMQQLNDDAKATEASSNYLNQAADLTAKYQTLQGKAAVDGLDPYKQSLEDLRNKMAGELNSPYTVQNYNQQTRFIQSRMVLSGASHAAEQNKAYAIGTIKANMDATTNAAVANPGDLDSAYAGLAKIKQNALDYATLEGSGGADSPITRDTVNKAASAHMSSWLVSLSKEQPTQAQKYYQKAVQDGNLSGDDIGKVNAEITSQMHIVAAGQLAQQAISGSDLHYGTSIVPLNRAANAVANYEGNDYNGTGPTTRHGTYGVGRYQVMNNNISPWLKEAGMADMTEAQFRKDHDAQDTLFNIRFGQYMQEGKSFNAAVSKWFTGSYEADLNKSDATPTTQGHTLAQYLTSTNSYLAKTASLGDITAHGMDLATAASPKDSQLPIYTQNHIAQLHGRQEQIDRDTDFNAKQTIDESMLDAVIKGQPITLNQISLDHKTAPAWQALQPSDKLAYADKLTALASNPRRTPEMEQEYTQLKGLQVQDPEAFLRTDVMSLNLPWDMKKEFIDDKASVYKGEQADPNTTRALDVLAPKLQDANLTKTGDSNGLIQFTGALRAEMKQFTLDNSRPPKDDEIETIGSRLLQKQATGLKHTWPSDQAVGKPLYQVDVPSAAADIIRRDPSWAKMGITPSDNDIQQIYVYNLYQSQFGKYSGASGGGPGNRRTLQ